MTSKMRRIFVQRGPTPLVSKAAACGNIENGWTFAAQAYDAWKVHGGNRSLQLDIVDRRTCIDRDQ